MVRWNALQPNRELRNGEQDAQELQCGCFHRVPGVPHEHVGMDGGVSAEQAQVHGAQSVVRRHVRSVRCPEHVPVLAHQRSDVGLAEFDHHVGVQGPEFLHHIGEQPVGCFTDGGVVPAVRDGELSRVGRHEESQEIEFESVDSPLAHRGPVGVDQVLAHFRIAGVEHPCALPIPVAQISALEFLEGLRVLSNQRHGVPQQELHSTLVHTIDEFAHVRNPNRLPVSGECISALAVQRLPAVVDDDRFVSEFLRQLDLAQELRCRNALVVAVPGRVHRQPREGGHRRRLEPRLRRPPLADVCQRLPQGNVSPVDADLDPGAGGRRLSLRVQFDPPADGRVFFPDPGP